MARIRRYRVRYIEEDNQSVHIVRIEEFRSLRHAGEFILKLLEHPQREFHSIEAVVVEKLTDQEKTALTFFTEGKLKPP